MCVRRFRAPRAVCVWPKNAHASRLHAMSDGGPSRLSRLSAAASGNARRFFDRIDQGRLFHHENTDAQAVGVLCRTSGPHGSFRVAERILKGIREYFGLLGKI